MPLCPRRDVPPRSLRASRGPACLAVTARVIVDRDRCPVSSEPVSACTGALTGTAATVMDAPEKQMSLPARQQVVLDQIERVLAAADPRLKSMFAAFARLTSPEALPATEVISDSPVRRRTVIVSIVVISALSLAMVFI